VQVFISWSGEQSNAVAVALRAWLPKVLAQRITPFVSSEDIDKGSRGLAKIASELEESNFGVVVVTPTNLESTWINFEAGALGKAVTDSRVAPLLVGLADADLDGPLKQFQNAAASDREAVRALVLSINKAHPEPFDATAVSTLFDAHWPEFEEALQAALALTVSEPEPKRTPEDLLDEVLVTVRSMQRDVAELRNQMRPIVAEDRVWSQLHKYAERLGPDRPLLRTSKGASSNDLLKLILTSVEGGTMTLTTQPGAADVDLDESTPRLSPDTLHDLQGLAVSQKLTITIRRPDGSAVRFDADGIESRRGPTEDDFTPRLGRPVDDA
jgi:hypothetical protein